MLNDALSSEIYLTDQKSSYHSGDPAILLMQNLPQKQRKYAFLSPISNCKVFLLWVLILDVKPLVHCKIFYACNSVNVALVLRRKANIP